MKKTILTLCILSLFISCKKNNDDISQVGLEHYPQKWLLTIDESVDKYTFLRATTTNVYRKQILKSFSLGELANVENCEYYIVQARSETGKACFTIQIEKQRNVWLHCGPSTNQQEVHTSATYGNSETTDPGGDSYKFFVHDMPKVDGIKTVAIESVWKPGYYISSSPPGFNYAQNQVTLQSANDPQQATHWQCR